MINPPVLDDATQSQYLGWEWLGRDLYLNEGDLAFGPDGDLVSHEDPILSFCDVLKYKGQVAANLIMDVAPMRVHNAVAAAVAAMRSDPRVGSVKINRGHWLVTNPQAVPVATDTRFFVVDTDVVLANGDSIRNLVVPIRYREAV